MCGGTARCCTNVPERAAAGFERARSRNSFVHFLDAMALGSDVRDGHSLVQCRAESWDRVRFAPICAEVTRSRSGEQRATACTMEECQGGMAKLT